MVEQLDLFYAMAMEEEKKPSENEMQAMFDKKHKQKKLTPRQWKLLELIKHNSLVEFRKTTQKEICDRLKDYGYEWNDDIKAHDHCTMIWSDIKDINLSYETDKLVISDNFEYWLGCEQETKDFIDKLWNDLEPRLMRYWAYLKKIERDGQGIMIDRKGNAIDEDSQARAFVESYGKERISDY